MKKKEFLKNMIIIMLGVFLIIIITFFIFSLFINSYLSLENVNSEYVDSEYDNSVIIDFEMIIDVVDFHFEEGWHYRSISNKKDADYVRLFYFDNDGIYSAVSVLIDDFSFYDLSVDLLKFKLTYYRKSIGRSSYYFAQQI